ncbi:PQQ-dependent sugar dehydrogenase [Aquihabitans sp. G128]|uniref:PQQ-dependent sugar dehydrogenase n=1 Tax=Aquihabitans sp. G128 TaxID=2849779 RepID=UPI001C21349F|nr:PQQ-dependent sugar dehydrogenase [Aquihabitans sp. G128]QXC61222.1 PQQ-dependent sugar dehydrogenase [Aquihabitans sp. G128]
MDVRTPSTRARRTRRGAAALAASAVLLVGAAGLSGCRTQPKTLTTSTVVSGLEQPWDIAFTPGGGMLFTEKVGRIKFRKATAGNPIVTLAAPSDVVVRSEGGMMGIAVDPKFNDNRRIYACFQSNKGGAIDVRLVRFTINASVTALTNRADLVTGIPSTTGRHNGCRPRFGPDGNIWVGTGDSAVGANPQSPTSLGGKVLRVNTDGAGVSGNKTAPFDHRIYTYGHRNVQGIAFSPGGKAYSIEHGTDRDDEVNRLVAGANYGWDPRPPGGGAGYDESQPMTNLTKYPNAKPAVWTSGNPTIAPSGGTFLKGKQWAGWQSALAIAVLKGQQLRVLGFDSDGAKVEAQWVEIKTQGRLRVAVQGPDGNLYLAQDANPGFILKVTPGG